ncbi:MAG TPA: hypothetical protein VJJ81_02890 [Candidatus Babeliales bacterium]|nr:hypothetical protein [Candidatus Babeliales bacterium]
MLIVLFLLFFDLCLAGYLHSFWLSTVLAYFVIQVAYQSEHHWWPKIILSGLCLILESFIKYPYYETTVILIFLIVLIGQYLAIELNSRRLASYLILVIFLGLQSSGLIIQAVQHGDPSIVTVGRLIIELSLDLAVITLFLKIPWLTRKNLIL